MHEASLHEDNSFVTLTYDEEHLPLYGSLDKDAVPLFMKRLRKRRKARYFYCGEYGEREGRPHYHALLFGVDFKDKELWALRGGLPVWKSAELATLWPMGLSEIGSLTFESAAYVARYVLKKWSGQARADYERVAYDTGEVVDLEPPFAQMSRNPGIGNGWFKKFSSDVFPSDEVVVNGKSQKAPRYYGNLHEVEAAEEMAAVRRARMFELELSENSEERLHVREVCTRARLSQFPRRLET